MTEVVIKLIGNYSYQTNHCLGEGVYGKVYEGIERETKQKVAVKKVDLNTFTNDKYLENAIFSEIYLLKRFNHPNIVKFKDVLSSKNSLYIITEYCKDGDLKELLLKKKRFKEEEAFEIIRQILCGFSQLVQQKIVHRDLKPANILINQQVYKIADFGFAKYVDNFGSQMLKSCVGSPIYMAPQILQRVQYTTKCDIWSIGIIFYEMLLGFPPYKARDQNQLLRNLQNISITQILKKQNFSLKVNEFLRKCLAYSEEERASWTELFENYLQKQQKLVTHIYEQPQVIGYMDYSQRNRMLSTPVTTPNSLRLVNNADMFKKSPIKYTTNTTTITTSHQIKNPILSNAEMIKNIRDQCIYKHFISVQLFLQLGNLKNIIQDILKFQKMLHVLTHSVKLKSTYGLSIMSLYMKGNKMYEDLQKRMQKEHDSYNEIDNDLNAYLEREQNLKKIREQIGYIIGTKMDIINEDKINKVQQLLLKLTCENTKILLADIHQRGKYQEDLPLIQILYLMYDILVLITNGDKGRIDLSANHKQDETDYTDYTIKVVNKVQSFVSKLTI